jgi:hypothetical protein
VENVILPIYEWETPASHYPEGQSGRIYLYRATVPAGKTLSMGGVMGYRKCIFLKPCRITILQEGVKDPFKVETIWMSDTPMEWYGMGEYAMRLKPPDILIGGLGLGLIVWHLSKRADIRKVTVIEISRDVINLVKPHLPKNIQVEVIEGDFIEEVPKLASKGVKFSSAFVDMWVSPTPKWKPLYEDARITLESWYPDIPHFYWGFQKKYEREIVYHWSLYRAYMRKASKK